MDTSYITKQLLAAEGGATFSFSTKQSIRADTRQPEQPTPGADEIINRLIIEEKSALITPTTPITEEPKNEATKEAVKATPKKHSGSKSKTN